MIPIQLTIEGLYSYQKRQVIDFESLTSAGLFGIFGATGSGKSSILEAISYALYGETERMNAREGRNYNMMNLKSDRAYIEFDFRNHENKIFRACRELRRNSRRFEEVRPPVVTFYEKNGDQWIPLDHSNAEKIIGLSYHNFKRTIIIPQGQFQEFLELRPTARTEMMKEIFQLHRFDLQASTRSLERENQSLLDQTEGELKGYEMISEEEIRKRKKEWSHLKNTLKETEKAHRLIDEKFQRLKLLKDDFEIFEKKKKEWEKMSKRETEVDEAEKRLKEFEKISGIFATPLKELTRLEKKTGEVKEQQMEYRKRLEICEKHLSDKKKEQDDLKSWYEQLPEKEMEVNDLSSIEQMKRLRIEQDTLMEREKKGKAMVREVEERMQKRKKMIAEKEKEADALRKQALDPELLVGVTQWFGMKNQLDKEKRETHRRVGELQQKLSEFVDKLTELKVDEKNYEGEYEVMEKTLIEREKALEVERSELEIRQRLVEYADELEEGKPCLLCGSTHHPQIVEGKDVSGDLAVVLHAIEKVRKEKVILQKRKSETEQILNQKKIFEAQLNQEMESIRQIGKQTEAHEAKFRWEGFDQKDPDAFKKRADQAGELNRQIEKIEKEVRNSRKQLEEEMKDLHQYQDLLQKIQMSVVKSKSGFDSFQSQLKKLKFEDFLEHSPEETARLREDLHSKNQGVKSRYEKLNQEIQTALQTKASLDTQNKMLIGQLEELQKNSDVLQQSLKEEIRKENLPDMSYVQKILNREINVEEERNQIQQFRLDFNVLKNEVVGLEKKLKSASFDIEKFEEEEEVWMRSGKKLKEVNDHVVGLEKELQRLEKEFEKKKTLTEKLNQLKRRAENLKVMSNLFKASGFVQYVSTIYLSQLCDLANVRFQRMTRNQLRLQLGENNEFEIVDYLNEGRSRSVKTLSGGQSFQVSLSLALALAESVQSNALAEKNFFFIDEGFGTQDAQSVNIIFETLLHLNKENKVVGIISHVEELKERIPMSLTIVNDPVKGSLIFDSQQK